MGFFNKKKVKTIKYESSAKYIESVNNIKLQESRESIFKLVFFNIDKKQNVNKFKYKNLPDFLNYYTLEKNLYLKGSILFTKILNKYMFLDFTPIDATNKNYLFEYKRVKTISQLSYLNNIEINTDITDPLCNGIIIYNCFDEDISQQSLNNSLIDFECSIIEKIQNNIKVSTDKVIGVSSVNSANVLKQDLKALFDSNELVEVLNADPNFKTIQFQNNYIADKLINLLKQIDNIRLLNSGIENSNFGIEKKERLITDEVESDERSTSLINDLLFESRKFYIDRINKVFNLNIEVYKNNGSQEKDRKEPDEYELQNYEQ